MNWFECKVKYEKTFEDGQVRPVIDSYVVDAASCADAEVKIVEQFHKDCYPSIETVNKRRYSDVFFNENAEKWYKGKVSLITIDEISGAEKKHTFIMLIQADHFKDAVKSLYQHMDGTMSDYEIVSLSETSIVDVIKLQE